MTRRKERDLRRALLSLKDVPPGLEIEKGGSADSGFTLRSSDPDCGPLVKLLKADKVSGSTAGAAVSFTGGQEGPIVDENLDAMGTSTDAAAVVEIFRRGVQKCSTVKLTVDGLGSTTLRVREISMARLADRSVAARFTATSGNLSGFELIQVVAHSKDVLVGMAFVGFDGADAEQATSDAVDKVEKRLGTGGSV